jgi:hypothetical protein
MERQTISGESKQESVPVAQSPSSPSQQLDWRTAIKELRELFAGQPSLEDEFMKERRSEKW